MQTLRRLVLRVSAGLRWLPPTLTRLVIGWVFLQSGWGKLHSLDNITEYFGSLHIPLPALNAPPRPTAASSARTMSSTWTKSRVCCPSP